MHFGRVDSLDGIDLSLPPNAPRTEAFLRLPLGGTGQIHAGCPIWNANSWLGKLYAPGTGSTDFLTAYSQQLNAVELNSSFYHLIDAARIATWKERVAPGFRFCPKLFRGITEQAGAPELADLVRRCAHGLSAFADTFGLAFAQFPETFSPREMPLLSRVLSLWPRSLPLAVEFRHPGWFKDHALLDEAVNLLYRHGAATVITDTPGRRDALHTSLTQPRVIVRCLGSLNESSDRVRFGAWAERFLSWAEKGLEDLYFFGHQPEDDLIPEAVNYFLYALQMRGLVTPAPWRKAVQAAKRKSPQPGLFDEGLSG